jgi:hypothetical protein
MATYAPNSMAGYNGQTGWRLPTQKELMDAYNHGIRSAASPNWIPISFFDEIDYNNIFWSASTHSSNTSNAWQVTLGNGSVGMLSKVSPALVTCVRP